MSLRTKLLALLLVFSVVPAVTVVFWMVRYVEDVIREGHLESLEALARAKASGVDQLITDRLDEVEKMVELMDEPLGELLVAERRDPEPESPKELPDLEEGKGPTMPEHPPEGQGGAGGAEEPEEEEDEPLVVPEPQLSRTQTLRTDLRRQLGLLIGYRQRFEELMVIDAKGRVVSSTFPEHEDKSAAKVPYFKRGLRGSHIEPVFLSPITGRPTMVIAVPIVSDNAEVIGVLAARLVLDRFFRFVNDHTGLGKTGETVVGKKVGEEVVFMAPTRHDASVALDRSVSLGASQATSLQEAARGQEGSGVQTDYRGHCTVAAWRHVPSLDWGLVAKIDCEEADGPLEDITRALYLVLAVLTVLAALGSVVMSSAFIRPLRKLQTAADRLSKGDFDVRLDIDTRDEIGDLARSFERMVAAMRFFRARARGETEADEELVDETTEAPESPPPAPSTKTTETSTATEPDADDALDPESR